MLTTEIQQDTYTGPVTPRRQRIERGDALRILEQSGSVRYVELLQTQRQRAPALKAAIEDLKAGRLENGWDKLERHGVIKQITDVATVIPA